MGKEIIGTHKWGDFVGNTDGCCSGGVRDAEYGATHCCPGRYGTGKGVPLPNEKDGKKTCAVNKNGKICGSKWIRTSITVTISPLDKASKKGTPKASTSEKDTVNQEVDYEMAAQRMAEHLEHR